MTKKGVVNLKGKAYKTVALRVSEFRETYKPEAGWSIQTDPLHMDAESVVFVARIIDPDGRIVATGHAEEMRSASQVNRTSAVENCETSAVGRALAAFGLAGEEYASADEVRQALEQQRRPKETPAAKAERQAGHHESWTKSEQADFCAAVKKVHGLDYDTLAAYLEANGWARPSAMDADGRKRLWGNLGSGMAVEVAEWAARGES